MGEEIPTAATGILVSVLATGGVLYVLRRIQLFDVPNERSSHTAPVPRGGGLGPMLAILTSCLVGWSISAEEGPLIASLVLSGGVLAGLGFVDDLRDLSARFRLLFQGAVALTATSLLVVMIGPEDLPWQVFALAAGTVWVVGYVNAFNFMDGVNGISGINAAVAGSWFAWVGHDIDQSALLVVGLATAGAAIGFLPWNSPHARVFLGDVGSYGLGAIVGIMALCVVLLGSSWLVAVSPLAVYLADTSWTLLVRLRHGQRIGEAHRDHVYQRLVTLGWTHLQVSCLVAATSALICLAVYSLEPFAAVILSALLLVAYLSSPVLWSRVDLKEPAQ